MNTVPGMAPPPDRLMLVAALWLADFGYAVFPCISGRKVPLTQNGLLHATTDPDQIERWWTEHPDANLAIRTEGLLVIDDDHGEDPWLADDPKPLQDLSAAPTSLTPRGGRHYIFRQPKGKNWRNTAGRLAPRVDTRANGGYIVVAPSTVNGKAYRWLDGHPPEVPPDCLPEPPAWLIELLDRLTWVAPTQVPDQPREGGSIPRGRRNATMASLAGSMRRVGMMQPEIAAALHRVNTDRCMPPLETREVDRIAESVARYAPNTSSDLTLPGDWKGNATEPLIPPLLVRDLLTQYPSLRPPVIHGLLRRGETMNVIAPPKTGKSWLVQVLAMCVAMGRPWLDAFQTVSGRVLIVDNELHPEALAHRIPRLARGLGISLEDIADSLSYQCLRGRLRDIHALAAYFRTMEVGRYALIVIDAFFRCLPPGTDENDNAAMANIYNVIDAVAGYIDCSFILIHHASKGSQSGKAVTDIGAGAGSQSRATDTHLVLRPHSEPGVIVLEAAVRSWPPVAPRCLEWNFPLWMLCEDLDPRELKGAKTAQKKSNGSSKPRAAPWTAVRFVAEFITGEPKSKAQIRLAAQGVPGLSQRVVDDLLDAAVNEGLAVREKAGWGGRQMFSRAKWEDALS